MVATRKRLTNGQRLKILADMDGRLANGESLKSIARLHGVQPNQLRDWRRNRAKLSSTLVKKRSSSGGRVGILKPFEEHLIGYALDQRAHGIFVTYGGLVVRACQLFPEFQDKPEALRYAIVRRLAIANCLVDRAITHISQRRMQDMIEEAQEWLTVVRPIVQAPNVQQRFVINMDQTPVFLSMHPKRTLDLRGTRTVHALRTSNCTARMTVSLAVSADGDKLKPMVIFKGQPDGRIATRELPDFETNDELLLCCQPNAWQDERNMRRWIDEILVPYLQERAEGVPVFLFLDQFEVHKSQRTRERLEELGIHLQLIPAGCTGLVQPVDVSIGKPFKGRVRKHWFDWMVAQNPALPTMANASREDAASWVADAWRDFDPNIIRNGWRKTDFNYF